MATRMLIARESGERIRGRSRLFWMGSVKVTWVQPTVEIVRKIRKNGDSTTWQFLPLGQIKSFRQPSFTLVAYHLERGGISLHDAVGVHCQNVANTLIKAKVPNICAKE